MVTRVNFLFDVKTTLWPMATQVANATAATLEPTTPGGTIQYRQLTGNININIHSQQPTVICRLSFDVCCLSSDVLVNNKQINCWPGYAIYYG